LAGNRENPGAFYCSVLLPFLDNYYSKKYPKMANAKSAKPTLKRDSKSNRNPFGPSLGSMILKGKKVRVCRNGK
jgi:hypothetical protein